MKKFSVKRYEPKDYDSWNAFIGQAKNATFLFHRDFMEYHKDRFQDYSLVVLDGEKWVAVLPANVVGDEVFSHQGLTYGGLVYDEKLKLAWVSFVKSRNEQYLLAFSAINLLPGKYLKGIFRRLGTINFLFPRKFLLPIVNYTSCEAHLDVTKEVFKNKLLKNENSDTPRKK